MNAWVRLLRPPQWIKNSFVLAPLLFSGRARDLDAVLAAAVAFVAFCVMASGVYALNDAVDRESDRAHPTKRLRPVAAGTISPRAAIIASGVLIVAGLVIAWQGTVGLGVAAGAYVVINLLYSFALKSVVILDVFALSSFFVLRLVAGAAAIGVQASIWLLLCGALLSLYLGFAKRRHELSIVAQDPTRHRSVLSHYSAAFLDQMSAVLLSVTVVAYIMYSLTSETAALVGSQRLAYSTVFVLYGVFRYLYVVHEKDGGSPTEALLTDPALLVTVALWLMYCGWVIYQPFQG